MGYDNYSLCLYLPTTFILIYTRNIANSWTIMEIRNFEYVESPIVIPIGIIDENKHLP